MKVRRAFVAGMLSVCAAGTGSAQTEWVRQGLVLERGAPGSWDDAGRQLTSVIKVDGVYHLFYTGWQASGTYPGDGEAKIGHATSGDGINWELDPANPVLRGGSEEAWDHAPLEGAAVVHDGSEFQMWYAAVTPGEVAMPFGFTMKTWHGVGLASSPDGSTWTKHPQNPVIHPGMLDAFEGRRPVPQTVILEEGIYRMWFVDPNISPGVGYAVSDDGLVWTEDPFVGPTLPGSLGRGAYDHLSVVSNGDLYYMFITTGGGGYPWNFLAASRDGLRWSMWARGIFWLGLELTVVSDGGVFEAWYAGQSGGNPIYSAISECCSTVFTWFLPGAAYGAGIGGSFFRTEVDVTNAGETAAQYRLAWLPRGEQNFHHRWTRSGLFELGPGMSVRHSNALAEVFGLQRGSFGTLAVESSSDALLALGRIATTPAGATADTCGQSTPAIRIDDFTRGWSMEHRQIVFGTEHEGARFNVACQSATRSAEINLDLFDVDGTMLETKIMRLESWGNDQLNRVFHRHSPVNGHVRVWSKSGDFYCFGSLVDNETSDAITIPPMGY